MRHRAMIIGTMMAWLVCMAAVVGAQDAQEWFDRGSDAFDAGNYAKAIEYYTRTIDLNPEYAYAYNNRAWAYYFLGRYEEALADLTRTIELDPEDRINHYGRGVVYEQLGRYDEAIGDYTRAIELDPGYALAYNNRAWVYTLKGDYIGALEDIEKALASIGDDDLFFLPIALTTRGNIYRELGRYNEAMADTERAIELNPEYYFAYYSRGLLYEELGKARKSKADFEYACEKRIIEACDALDTPGK